MTLDWSLRKRSLLHYEQSWFYTYSFILNLFIRFSCWDCVHIPFNSSSAVSLTALVAYCPSSALSCLVKTVLNIHMHMHMYLVFTGECQVFYLHLLPSTSREKNLMETLAIVCVHDGNGTPISAHPEGVSPYSEACDGEECTVIRDGYLHLVRGCRIAIVV